VYWGLDMNQDRILRLSLKMAELAYFDTPQQAFLLGVEIRKEVDRAYRMGFVAGVASERNKPKP
jgi:hypothetical protein